MIAFAEALASGWYKVPGASRLIFLCGGCAEKRNYWPSDFQGEREPYERKDCADCGGKVE